MQTHRLRRNSSLTVKHVPERHCWVALPRVLCVALRQQGTALPLPLRLVPEATTKGVL
jgi:hypothetical protein